MPCSAQDAPTPEDWPEGQPGWLRSLDADGGLGRSCWLCAHLQERERRADGGGRTKCNGEKSRLLCMPSSSGAVTRDRPENLPLSLFCWKPHLMDVARAMCMCTCRGIHVCVYVFANYLHALLN